MKEKCKKLYEKFLDSDQYHRVFAYGARGESESCYYNVAEYHTLEVCNKDLFFKLKSRRHECKIYAKSPVNGKVAIVWKEEEVVQVSRRTHSDRLTCIKAVTSGGQDWESETGKYRPYVLAARQRGLNLNTCRDLIAGNTAARNGSGKANVKAATIKVDDVKIARTKVARINSALGPLRKKHREAIAVIIGNRNYKGRIHKVDFAHNDADAMKRFVLDRLGYRDGNVIDLRDASQAQMLAVFGNSQTHEGKLFNWVKPDKSDVTVFYSGHGVPGMRDRRAYLLPVDGDADHAEITGVPIDTLFANLAKIPARSMTVFLDACFSGESPKGTIVRSTSGISVAPKMPASASNMTVITAAQGDQFASWDEKAGHGLFTKHLLEALEGAADEKGFGNADGKITLAEVQTYLDEEMTYQARRTWGRRQNASVRGDTDRALAYLTPGAMTAIAPPKPANVVPVAKVSQPEIEEMHAIYTVLSTANLRAGPSTSDPIVGGLAADSRIIVDGRVTGKNWYRLDDGSFIYGGLIKADE